MGSTNRPEPPDGDDSGAFVKSFGRQVKLFRERAGLTQAELGRRLNYGPDMVAAVECGWRIAQPEMIDRADEVLDAHGVLKAMKDEVARARYPGFFRSTARIEAQAVEVHVYATQAVPGLLQTEAYARAVCVMWRPLLDEQTIEQRVASRMARQQIFSRAPAPLLSFVIEKVILQRPLGGKEVVREQLERLLQIGRRRHVELQVMPSCREEHAGLAGPFTLTVTRTHQRMAYTEVQSTSHLLTDRSRVRELEAAYGTLRAQALTPQESLTLIEKYLGDTWPREHRKSTRQDRTGARAVTALETAASVSRWPSPRTPSTCAIRRTRRAPSSPSTTTSGRPSSRSRRRTDVAKHPEATVGGARPRRPVRRRGPLAVHRRESVPCVRLAEARLVAGGGGPLPRRQV